MSERSREARQLRDDGFTVVEICERMGISRNWYYNLLNIDKYRKRNDRYRTQKKIARFKRSYECSVCGQQGHNSRRHDR